MSVVLYSNVYIILHAYIIHFIKYHGVPVFVQYQPYHFFHSLRDVPFLFSMNDFSGILITLFQIS